jgi:hypothetical protein
MMTGNEDEQGAATMRHVLYVLFFLLGGAAGVFWGVHHPAEAARVADDESVQGLKVKAAVAKAKIELLQKFQGSSNVDVKPMINDEQKNLDDAQHQLTH